MKKKILYGSITVFLSLFILLSFYQWSSWKGGGDAINNAAWYNDLPACPCNYSEVQPLDETHDPQGNWLDCREASQTYHYGATFEARWAPATDGQPGQQCTYDENGVLITEGIAAGTPDKVSPHACGFGISNLLHITSLLQHKQADVDTWKEEPCTTYLANWPPNNANYCQPNPGTSISHMEKLVGTMSCEEITALFKVVDQYDGNGSLYAYFHDPSATPPSQLKKWMKSLQEKSYCEEKNNAGCRALQQALNNLEG